MIKTLLGFLKIGVVGSFLAVVLGWGCGRHGAATVKLSSWGDVKENAILSELIDDFQKLHPDIKVELQRVPWSEYTTKLLTQMAANTAPDVIFLSGDTTLQFASRGALEPLDDKVQADPDFPLKDFYPELIRYFTISGHLYGIPRDISPVCVLYYNKKAFDAAGLAYPSDDWTWDDFLKDAKLLTKREADGHTSQWAFIDDWTMVEPWVYSFGGSWVDDPYKPTKFTFDSPAFVKGLEFRADLILKHKVMPSPTSLTAMGGVGTAGLFMNGSVAMFLSELYETPKFRDIKDFDWDVAMCPSGPKGRAFQGGGSGYGILSSSTHKKEAWELVRYLAGPEGQKRMATTGLVQPALKSIANSPVFLDGQTPYHKKIVLDAVPFEIFDPLAMNWMEIKLGNILPTFDRVWSGKLTPSEGVSQLSADLKSKPLVTGVK
jgi:ABC-type glycerol-3-phosphate transport system substrate-binding protein